MADGFEDLTAALQPFVVFTADLGFDLTGSVDIEAEERPGEEEFVIGIEKDPLFQRQNKYGNNRR